MSQNNQTKMSVIIGTWGLGDKYWGEQTHSDSLKTLHAAAREGFKHYDTSPVYGNGKSEQLLGQQFKGDPSLIFTTKSFIKPNHAVKKSIYNSLKRLQRDYIDTFLVHWPSTKVDCRPMIQLLEDFRKKGIIKKIGLSNFNKKELVIASEAGKIDIVQNAFNFFWNKDTDYLKYCKSEGIGTEVYSPLAQGLLAGKISRQTPYKGGGDRDKMVLFSPKNLELIYSALEELNSISLQNNTTLPNLILSWTMEQDFIDHVIVGCRKRKHIEDLTKLGLLELSEDNLVALNRLHTDISREIEGENNIFNHSY